MLFVVSNKEIHLCHIVLTSVSFIVISDTQEWYSRLQLISQMKYMLHKESFIGGYDNVNCRLNCYVCFEMYKILQIYMCCGARILVACCNVKKS
jgi:hypothetical protein